MQISTLHQIGTATIDFDPSVPCLIHVTSDFMMSKEFRLQMNAGLELLIKKKKELGNIAWIADARRSDVLASEDILWLTTDWNQRVLDAGIKYIAILMSEKDLSNFTQETYVDDSVESINKGLIIQKFPDLESAKAWLREVLQ